MYVVEARAEDRTTNRRCVIMVQTKYEALTLGWDIEIMDVEKN